MALAFARPANKAAPMLLRSLRTSSASLDNGVKYTHASPGSSIKDPLALNVDSPAQFLDGTPVEGVGQQGHAPAAQAAGKKAGPLRVSNVDALKHKARKLEPQTTTGFGLPPGCSIKDPSYSIRDPVYFTQ